MNKIRTLLVVCVVSLLAGNLHAENWPQWRGAQWDSISHESDLPESIGEDNQLWRLELPGPGGASPIVWEDSLFLTSVGKNGELLLMHFSVDGELRWQRKLDGRNVPVRMDNANSASPSPFTDGEHVWAIMTDGLLYCFDFAGNRKWAKDLQEIYGEFDIQFGMTSTPILDRGKIYLQLIHGNMRDQRQTSRGWVVALDALSGDEIWKHRRLTDATAENKHAYTSPTIYRDDQREFLITHGGDYAIGHSLKDGSEIWRCGGLNPRDSAYNPFLRFVSSPVCVEGLIVVPSAKRGRVFALNPANLKGDLASDDSFAWKLERGTPDVSSPVVYENRIYLAGEKETLSCYNASNGELVYKESRFLADRQRSTPVIGDQKIYITERNGTVTVLRAGDEPKVLSRYPLKENTTASPAISGGRVFVRTAKALYAFGKKEEVAADMKFAIAIHGGAGSSPDRFSKEANERRRESMKKALEIGTDILKNGGTALDAVEKVVVFLENDPQFNAGVGAVFNAADSHELDASIMDGSNLKAGAVCGVSHVKNPISLARMVMNETRHVLLAAEGAEKFAAEMKVPMVEPTHFDTPATLKRWEMRKAQLKKQNSSNEQEIKKKIAIIDEDTGSYLGTVGCVALDGHGNLAAATSTGGMTNKKFGRVGDSPIVGAGTYADNRSCAVSGTGIGEQYIRNAVAYDISAQMRYMGKSLDEAVQNNLDERLNPGDGGIIAVDHLGNISMGFNTNGMARAAADSSGKFEVVWGDPDKN